MKKLILISIFLLVTTLSFSESCSWTGDPNKYERKTIELVKKNKLESKIYCDNDDFNMVYTVGAFNQEMEIGLVYNENEEKELTFDEFKKIEEKFRKDLNLLLPNNLTMVDSIGMPQYYNYRLYVYVPEEEDTFMLLKYQYDVMNKEWNGYYNEEFFDDLPQMVELFKELDYYSTDDIIY